MHEVRGRRGVPTYPRPVPDLTASVLAAEAALGSRAAAWDAVLATIAAGHGLDHPTPAPPVGVLDPWRGPDAIEHLGSTYEGLAEGRQASGTFYTPPDLVAWVLDRALPAPTAPTPTPRRTTVLDPACGSGHVLVAAARRLVDHGLAPREAVELVHGVDLDPIAVAITRLRLRVLAPDAEPDVRVGDGLGEHPGAPYDVVVGNPPFLGRLRPRAPRGGPAAAPTGLGAYTDTSAVFLHRALDLVRPGGTVALVQPLSLLGARDAAPVRAAVAAAGAVTAFWSSVSPVFPGTTVLTCVPVVTTGAPQGRVATWHGPAFTVADDLALPPREWGPLAAPAAGIPVARPRTAGVLGDLATCTADFRDQYYGLVPYVGESADREGLSAGSARLVTSGLIDPAECRWGRVPTRFNKVRYAAPTVDLEALHADGALSGWARARRVPKLLVATQGRVVEAVVDERGDWLPSVPVLTVTSEQEHLWRLLAVLLSPPVVAAAAARYLGTALAPGAIKLSASQVAGLPLPADRDAWDEGARLAEAAQRGDDAGRRDRLLACAAAMCTAYDDDTALGWWAARLRPA